VIFISRSSEDSLPAETLKSLLAAVLDIVHDNIEITCLHDEGLAAEGEIGGRLRDAIGSCGVFFAILTPASIKEEWMLFELGAAWALGKKIILLFLDGTGFCDLPTPLAGFRHLDMAEQDAPLQMMAVCRDVASFLDLGLRRGSSVLTELEGMAAAMRREPVIETRALSAKPDNAEARLPAYSAGPGKTAKTGKTAKWGAVDYCEIACEAESALKKVTISVKILWDDLFKAIAPNIREQRDEAFVERLVLDLCRERDPNLKNGLAYKLLKTPAVNPDSFGMILSRLTLLGYIDTSRPPYSIFQKDTRHTFWKITPLGEDYLREIIAERRKIGV
jgi:hypothetical protein